MAQDSFKRAKCVKFNAVPEIFTIAAKSSTSFPEKRSKSKVKASATYLESVNLQPDLDIVSGFAFLSFETCEELQTHIVVNEVNTRSLSVDVGQKHKLLASGQAKGEVIPQKKIRAPAKKKIIGQNSRTPKSSKTNVESNTETGTCSNVAIIGSSLSAVRSSESESSSLKTAVKRSNSNNSSPLNSSDSGSVLNKEHEISLECSEKIDTYAICDDALPGVLEPEVKLVQARPLEASEEKKHGKKKRKRGKSLNDQTCQTMFRIKKKKKNGVKNVDKKAEVLGTKPAGIEYPGSNTGGSGVAVLNHPEIAKSDSIVDLEVLPDKEESNIQGSKLSSSGIVSNETDTNANEISDPKVIGIKSQLSRTTKKVEKIDYCARSGGLSLLEKYHKKRSIEKLCQTVEPMSSSAAGQQLSSECEWSKNSSSDVMSSQVDTLSDVSGNESTCSNTSISDNNLCDFSDDNIYPSLYTRNKSRPKSEKACFIGSTTILCNKDEENNTDWIDIESVEHEVSKTFVVVSSVKGLSETYMLGHFSMYPEETKEGTVDVSIQSYDNDIQLYLKHASEQDGKIIKIITPDDDEDDDNPLGVMGLPRFLRPPEHIKAVRSATERNRRHAIGDLFYDLKNELFTEAELYFSKQAILSKAISTVKELEKEVKESKERKKSLKQKNIEWREKLNMLLFDKNLPEGQAVDVEKLIPWLKTNMNIEIAVPLKAVDKTASKEEMTDVSQTQNTGSIEQAPGTVGKNVSDSSVNLHTCSKGKLLTRKGRPPQLGKFLNLFKAVSRIPSESAGIATPARIATPEQLSKSVKVALESSSAGDVAVKVFPHSSSKPADAPTLSSADVKKIPISKANQTKDEKISEATPILQRLQKIAAKIPEPSSNKIICNISRYCVNQCESKARGVSVVTMLQPMKAMESKDVVHIKIANDVMQRVGSQDTIEPQNKPIPAATASLVPIPLHGVEQSDSETLSDKLALSTSTITATCSEVTTTQPTNVAGIGTQSLESLSQNETASQSEKSVVKTGVSAAVSTTEDVAKVSSSIVTPVGSQANVNSLATTGVLKVLSPLIQSTFCTSAQKNVILLNSSKHPSVSPCGTLKMQTLPLQFKSVTSAPAVVNTLAAKVPKAVVHSSNIHVTHLPNINLQVSKKPEVHGTGGPVHTILLSPQLRSPILTTGARGRSGIQTISSTGNLVTLQTVKPVPASSAGLQHGVPLISVTRGTTGGTIPYIKQPSVRASLSFNPVKAQVPVSPAVNMGVATSKPGLVTQTGQTLRTIAPLIRVTTPPANQVTPQPVCFQLLRVPLTGSIRPSVSQAPMVVPVQGSTASVMSAASQVIHSPFHTRAVNLGTTRFASPLNSSLILQSTTPGSQTGSSNITLSVSSTGKVSVPPSVSTGQVGRVVTNTLQVQPLSTQATLTTSSQVSTSVVGSPSVGSGETFSEIEKILAKIPSAPITFSRQIPGQMSSLTDAQGTIPNSQTRDLSAVQVSITPSSSIQAGIMSSVAANNPFVNVSSTCISGTDFVTNQSQQETTSSSTTCLSLVNPTMYQAASTISDTESGLAAANAANEHVVTADTLSCNIENSIPDIANELPFSSGTDVIDNNITSQGFHKTSSQVAGLQTQSTLVQEREVNKRVGLDIDSIELAMQDESTAGDFDLLASLEWEGISPGSSAAMMDASKG